MDAHYEFTITNVPNRASLNRLTRAIERAIFEASHTDIVVVPEIEE